MVEPRTRIRLRTLLGSVLGVGLLVGATVLAASYFTDLRTLLHVLANGQWPWIAGAVGAQVAYLFGYALFYRLGFAVVGVSSRTWSLVPVLFTGLFVNQLVPTGAGAAAVFVDDAVRRGQSGARVTVGVVLVLVLDLLAVLPFVVWGIAFLVHRQLFASWQLFAAGAFAMYVVLLVVLLALSHAKQASVCRALTICYRVIHRVLAWIRVRGPSVDWPARTAAGFADAAAAIAANRGQLALAGVWGIAIHLLNAFGLWLFVRGFGADVPLGGLIAAYALGVVLVVIAVIPQFAPISQAFVTATFIGVGMATGPAVASTLAFRGLALGLPLVVGLPFAYRFGRFRVDVLRGAT
ncbi:MAG TPA: lysylphosphatidylglycerol synthase domain-containing protein [Kofleriaceae bacterium]|nr:lysylphosphatidylglycerol synthase domain-containing protein [Kofleriaceae bacterium]